MTLSSEKFPSSAAFDVLAGALKNDADRQGAIKQGNGVFVFTLKNTEGQEESWFIDLKDKGEIGKGMGLSKPTVALKLADADFGALVAGQVKAQKLFMSGKLKISGDIMKATKLDPILKKAQPPKAKL